ncbi:MAG: hypothetical protein K9M10_04125 [Candidatus Pacebacteria bacterium]|nr:hypothetical protein [Candidatus Paceibacterota bacterium]MCF7857632.1 hypothetical protein [Candidatus Paceibacterota bacterium]
MINLIPPEGQTVMRREYMFRTLAAFSLLFAGVFVLLTVSLIPTYVLIEAQINEFQFEITQSEQGGGSLDKVKQDVNLTKEIITQLKTPTSPVVISEAIDAIQSLAPQGIFFKTFTADGSKGNTIQLQGTSLTRDTLSRFKQVVEKSDMFNAAEIPISDLAHDANLPFVMTITLAGDN